MMRRLTVWTVGVLLALAVPVVAAEPAEKIVRDTWDVIHIEGGKVGFFHTTIKEVERDGKKFLRATMELDLSIRRGNATAWLRMQTGNDETPEGKVTGVAMRQFLDKDQQNLVTGVVEGDKLHIKTSDLRVDKLVPWNDKVIGLAKQEKLFQDNKVKPGDTLSYLSYEPSLATVITVRATVKNEEEVEILGVKKKLLRVEAQPDKIEAANGKIQLPPTVWWLDKELLPVRMQMEMPGLGQAIVYRTTKEVALAVGPPPKPGELEILSKNLLVLNQALPRAGGTKSVVYRLKYRGDDDPLNLFAQDDRQTIQNAKGKTFELVVNAVRTARDNAKPGEPGKEFTESCYYLNSDAPQVKEAAEKAVGKETDPWKKAQLIEKWLSNNLKYDNAAAFAPSDKIVNDCKGDCRHAGVLGAALCRAAGVPSRTAVGLVYVEDRAKGPCLAFHMWFEVWIKGQWLALDGTQGLGSVGADHIKIADSSWHDVQTLTPFLPVSAVLGKIDVEIVKVE